MPFPFGKSQKSPAEIVKTLRENVAYMEKLDAGDSKKCEKVSNVFFCLLSVSYLKIGSYSQHRLMFDVINCFYTPRLQRRRPKI